MEKALMPVTCAVSSQIEISERAMGSSKSITIIVPVYNESSNIGPFLASMLQLKNTVDLGLEVLFVDDGSSDDSVKQIKNLGTNSKELSIALLELSRNFGKEAAVSAGLSQARGDAVVIIDCDLQHPPELIPVMVQRWREGVEVVATRRVQSGNPSWRRAIGSTVFHWGMRLLSDLKAQRGMTDFCLMDKEVVTVLNLLTERNRLVRGLIDWVGYRREVIEFAASHRSGGESGFSYSRLFELAINALVSFSLRPLRFTAALGAGTTALASALFVVALVDRFFVHWLNISNLAMVAIFNSLLIGIVLFALGIVAIYIGHVQSEVLNRPLFIVRRRWNSNVEHG
jgi:glycosyltransferase involved in cell wall biosynthesis